MSIHIDQVLEYLDSKRICQTHSTMESLMEGIHEAYLRSYTVDETRIRALFDQLRQTWEPSSPRQFDALFCCVCDLLAETELQAFSQGVHAGMVLLTQLNQLP